MTASAAPTLGLTLTELARQSAAQLAGTRYRSASDGAWCEPAAPHVDGCTCAGGPRCDACWRAWQHHVAASEVR